jgi:hypothetical protein
MEIVNASETSSISTRLHSATSQKKAVLMILVNDKPYIKAYSKVTLCHAFKREVTAVTVTRDTHQVPLMHIFTCVNIWWLLAFQITLTSALMRVTKVRAREFLPSKGINICITFVK